VPSGEGIWKNARKLERQKLATKKQQVHLLKRLTQENAALKQENEHSKGKPIRRKPRKANIIEALLMDSE